MHRRTRVLSTCAVTAFVVLAVAVSGFAQKSSWGRSNNNEPGRYSNNYGESSNGPNEGGKPKIDWGKDVIIPLLKMQQNARPPHPQGDYYPDYYQPQYIQPQYVQPQQTAQPPETPLQPNKIEAVPVEVVKNSCGFKVLSLTNRDRRNEIDDLRDANEKQGERLEEIINGKAGDYVDKELNAYSDAEKKAIKKAIAEGKDPGAEGLLTKGVTDAQKAKLKEYADNIQSVKDFVDNANDGKTTEADVVGMGILMADYVKGDAGLVTAAATATLRLAANGYSIQQLETANLNTGDICLGDADVILVGGMNEGEIVWLGNGTVLVGTGNPESGFYFGSGNVAQLAGYSAGVGDSLPESEAPVVFEGIVLINTGKTLVNYNINNTQYSLKPGYQQTWPPGENWAIEFDRGGELGKQRYVLTEGTYRFTPTEAGWELFKHPFKVTIDNAHNPFAFNYVVDNQKQTLAANQKQLHENPYRLIVRFDNGRGQEKRKKVESGVYRVGVAPDGTIDLYAEDDVIPPVKIADVIPSDPTPEKFFKDPKRVTSRLFTNRLTPETSKKTKKKHSGIFGAKKL